MITIESEGGVDAEHFFSELGIATTHMIDKHTQPTEAAIRVQDFLETSVIPFNDPMANKGLEILLLATSRTP